MNVNMDISQQGAQKNQVRLEPDQLYKNILCTDEPKMNLSYQNDGKRKVWRRKGTAHDLVRTLMYWENSILISTW